MLERAPVLHDRREADLVGEQPLLRMRDEVVEHLLHPSAPAEIAERRHQAQLAIRTCADQEHDEVAVDLRRHTPASDLRHPPPPILARCP
jgi:hypothetical protein